MDTVNRGFSYSTALIEICISHRSSHTTTVAGSGLRDSVIFVPTSLTVDKAKMCHEDIFTGRGRASTTCIY